MTDCRATATSFFIALDPTKRPAPVWRCYSETEEFGASGRCRAGWMRGASAVTRW